DHSPLNKQWRLFQLLYDRAIESSNGRDVMMTFQKIAESAIYDKTTAADLLQTETNEKRKQAKDKIYQLANRLSLTLGRKKIDSEFAMSVDDRAEEVKFSILSRGLQSPAKRRIQSKAMQGTRPDTPNVSQSK
ncbi:MAG: hypothetical protein H7062_20155, partial [Candidatus Saccharimonas sp.]|nr:hypothetical protein [Planctomycetaceae bacterium]